MTSQSEIIIDNTTVAASGRVLHRHDAVGDAAKHINHYYDSYSDGWLIDKRSFLEFLTSLLLFDRLIWNGASAYIVDTSWPYSWWLLEYFPLLNEAHKRGIVTIEMTKEDDERLIYARALALKWAENFQLSTLPQAFHLPEAYKAPEYYERTAFIETAYSEGIQVSESQLNLAMFLSRGLFYRSTSLERNGISYLPHFWRSYLLAQPSTASLSLACSPAIGPKITPISSHELIQDIDGIFRQHLQSALHVEGLEAGAALPGAFLNKNHDNASAAFLDILRFRDTPAGKKVRSEMRKLLTVADGSDKQALKARLELLGADLRNIQREITGRASRPHPNSELLREAGDKKIVLLLERIWDLVPPSTQETLSRIANFNFNKSGFQLIFSYYFPITS